MKLVCKSRYNHSARGLHFEAGVIRVDDDVAGYLLSDAPENFDVYIEPEPEPEPEPEVKTTAIEKPVVDKVIRSPRRKKAAGK